MMKLMLFLHLLVFAILVLGIAIPGVKNGFLIPKQYRMMIWMCFRTNISPLGGVFGIKVGD